LDGEVELDDRARETVAGGEAGTDSAGIADPVPIK